MPRFPTGRVLAVLLAFAASGARGEEAWQLGDGVWDEVAKPDPLTPAGQLQLLRRDLVAAQPKDGAAATDGNRLKLDELFRKHPRLLSGPDGKPLAGEALAARRAFWDKLLFACQPAATDEARDAAQEVKDKADLWLKANPRHPREPEARLLRGDALFARGEYWKALYDYERVARHFTATPSFFVALERERRVAEIFLGGWKRKFLGMRIIPTREEGVELLVRIQERVPGSAMAEEAGMRLGDWYFEGSDMEMAVEAYSVLLQTHPQTRHESFVLRRIIEASMARFAGPRFDSTGLIEARQRIGEYAKKYPSDAEKLGVDALLLRIGESLALRDLHNARWYERRGEHVSAVLLLRRIVATSPTTKAAREAKDQLEAWNEPLVDPRDPAALAAAKAAAKEPEKKQGGTP